VRSRGACSRVPPTVTRGCYSCATRGGTVPLPLLRVVPPPVHPEARRSQRSLHPRCGATRGHRPLRDLK
jgi:hypothetical protein